MNSLEVAMTFTGDETVTQSAQAFRSLDVDEQLALFWFVYKEMGSSITPAAPGADTASSAIAEGLFNQVKDLSHEEQLQLQRDLVSGADTVHTREYGSMKERTKLLFWYRLAQGMESSTIIPMPPGYELSSEADNLLNQIKGMDFNQQITLFSDVVDQMGSAPKAGAEI
ncbi:MAG TPA: orange carotenoid protein N-terminal domain-containing protein [Candidatus Caenarcaniphilales bacterium]